MNLPPSKPGLKEVPEPGETEGTRPRTRHSRVSQVDVDKTPAPAAPSSGTEAEVSSSSVAVQDESASDEKMEEVGPTDADKSAATSQDSMSESNEAAAGMEPSADRVNRTPPEQPPRSSNNVSLPRISPSGEPKVIKKGDQVITSYVDEKTGKITVYEPGIKLEVSDYAGKWYAAKVVEVDGDEQEILVHFEHWSSRFDEWIKMDSNRLRPSPNTNIVKTQFKVGEQVEALWNTDGQKYPGVIQSVLPNDYYQVLFDDGIKLKKKSNQIFKLKPVTRNISRSSTTSSTAPVQTPNSRLMRPLPELTPISRLISSSANKANASQGLVSSTPPPLIPRPKAKSLKSPAKLHTTLAGSSKVLSLTESPPPPILFPQTEAHVAVPATAQYTNVFAQIDTELGKRKRTVKDYSVLLKTPIRPEVSEVPLMVKRRYRRRDNSLPESLTPAEAVRIDDVPVETPPSTTGVPKLKKSRSKASSPSSTKKIPSIVIEKSPTSATQAELEDEQPTETTKPVDQLDESLPASVPATPVSEVPLEPEVPAKRSRKATEKALALFASLDDCPLAKRIQRRKPITRKIAYPRSRSRHSLQPEASTASPPKSPIPQITVETVLETYCPPSVKDAEPHGISESDSSLSIDKADKTEKVDEDPNPKNDSTSSQSEVQPVVAPATTRTRRSTNRPFSRRSAVPAIRPEAGVQPSLLSPESSNSTSVPPAPLPAPSPAVPVSTEPTPLAKRKRTIHDYSMLLKTRPKFFFDIEEETQRPNRLTCTKKSRVSKSTEADQTQSSSAPAETAGSDNLVKSESDSTEDEKKVATEQKPETSKSVRRASVPLTSRKGPLTLTPEEIQVVSTRTSEPNVISGASIILPASIKSTPTPSTSRLSASSRRQASQTHPESVKQPTDSKPRVPLLGSSMSNIEVSLSDEEELLDIDIDFTSSVSVSKPKGPPPPPQPTQRSTLSTVRKTLSRRTRPNNRWWKKKTPSAIALQRSRALAAGRARAKLPPPPPPPPKPGDVLNGISSRRIKKIRKSLADIGAERQIEGEPAFKDVSVDIINCWCRKKEESGLMIQCESCLCWQHGQCYGIETVQEMPTHYVCEWCQVPDALRTRMENEWRYGFHKGGELPAFGFAKRMSPETVKMFEGSNELMAQLYEVREIIHSTRVNLQIMQTKPDHKKLYQWDLPHKTIREEAQETRFNKIFRPILRRLLKIHKDDPKFIDKIRPKIQTFIRNGFRSVKLSTLKKANVSQASSNRNKPGTSTHVVNLEDDLYDDDCVDLTDDTECPIDPIVKIEIKEETAEENNDPEISLVVSDLMSEMLTNLEQDVTSTSSSSPERPSVIQQVGSPNVSPDPVEDIKPSTEIVATDSLGEDPSISDPLKELMTDNVDVGLDINNSDLLMDFDPSDPKFSTMAEDLVKSCCEEPEGLIKTLEDLAQQTEGVANLGTSDSDLMNFLDDDFMDSLDQEFDAKAFNDSKTFSSVYIPPVNHFRSPAPPTLTRITPELCRENLTLTILDQQKVIDEQLDEIEAKVNELVKLKNNGVADTSSQMKRIDRIQRKTRRLMGNLQDVKTLSHIYDDRINEEYWERRRKMKKARRDARRARREARRAALGIVSIKKEEGVEGDETGGEGEGEDGEDYGSGDSEYSYDSEYDSEEYSDEYDSEEYLDESVEEEEDELSENGDGYEYGYEDEEEEDEEGAEAEGEVEDEEEEENDEDEVDDEEEEDENEEEDKNDEGEEEEDEEGEEEEDYEEDEEEYDDDEEDDPFDFSRAE